MIPSVLQPVAWGTLIAEATGAAEVPITAAISAADTGMGTNKVVRESPREEA